LAWISRIAGLTTTAMAGAVGVGDGGASGAPAATGTSELTGLYRWLVSAWRAHPHVYAAGCVIALLALGAVVGLASEAFLSRFGTVPGHEPDADTA
jgi:hypothetical protein